MKMWIGVTDNQWFKFLAERQPDEVNFWQPGGTQRFRVLEPGGLFLFKLHSPLDYIAGGGFFVRHSFLPLSIAWETFGEKNGSPDYSTLQTRIRKYRQRKGGFELDPVIGCIILAEPFFFDEKNWIPVPENWSPNIVQGKTYDTREHHGSVLWQQVQHRLLQANELSVDQAEQVSLVREESPRYGTEYLTRARLGQGAFRVLVTEAYSRRCAVTGERTLPVLEASHIKPHAKSGPNYVNNGLLLRADLHRLFDSGYMTITQDLHVEVSRRVKEDYDNGKEYYAHHGSPLEAVPPRETDVPSEEFIEWHNQNRFVA